MKAPEVSPIRKARSNLVLLLFELFNRQCRPLSPSMRFFTSSSLALSFSTSPCRARRLSIASQPRLTCRRSLLHQLSRMYTRYLWLEIKFCCHCSFTLFPRRFLPALACCSPLLSCTTVLRSHATLGRARRLDRRKQGSALERSAVLHSVLSSCRLHAPLPLCLYYPRHYRIDLVVTLRHVLRHFSSPLMSP